MTATAKPPVRRSPQLAVRMLLGLVPGTLLLTGLTVLFNYYAARRQILQGVALEVAGMGQQASEHLESYFRQRQRDARSLAETPLLRDYLKNLEFGLDQEAASLERDLAQYYAQFAAHSGGVYRRVAFYRRDGSPPVAGGMDAAAAPRSLEPRPRGEAGETFADGGPDGSPARMMIWAAVPDDAGRAAGWVALECDLDRLRRILERAIPGRSGRAALLDGSGRERIGDRRPIPGAILSEVEVAGTPWRVRLMARPEEFLGPLRRIRLWALLASLGGGLFLTAWIWWFSRKLTRPIEEMAEGTRHLAGGDLDFRFVPPPIAELSTLGEAFNEMARSLKERNHELNARIRELTALREMEGAVIQRLEEEAILRTALKAICAGLALDRAGLYWLEPERGLIVGRYHHGSEAIGLTEAAFRRRAIPLGGDDILNEVVRSRAALLVKDRGRGDPRVDPAFVSESRTSEFVLAPVLGTNRVFGVIAADNCYTERPLSESDREGLTLFAHAAGLAIENASLFSHLARSEARYRTVLENAPVAILGVSGAQHFISTWSLGAEVIFGYSAPEILGKPLAALLPAESTEEYLRLMSEVVEKGSVRDYAIRGRTRDGRGLDLNLSWGGALPGFWMNTEWTVVIRDVTESKKLQQQVIRSEKLSAVGQLISGIAHELNNPLQAVVGYSQLLSREAKAGLKADLRMILESAERCRKIIDNLLLFVRQGKIAKRSVSVPKAVRASLDLLEYKLHKTQAVKVRVRLPRGLPEVEADFQQLQQVLMNLVNNACDALTESPGPREIVVSAAARERSVRLEVSDNGPGIPPELQERIFEPFFSTKAEGVGTGLGLAICRQIIADHGGTMGVESLPGEGASFWIELPAASSSSAAKAAAPRAARPPRRRGRAVLLVDDDATVLAFLKRALERDAWRVTTAASLPDASRKAARAAFDLVVADLHLGEEGGGLELYEGWSGRTAHPRPPFLFVTGDLMTEELRRRLPPRGTAFLNKPVGLEEFRAAAARLLSKDASHA